MALLFSAAYVSKATYLQCPEIAGDRAELSGHTAPTPTEIRIVSHHPNKGKTQGLDSHHGCRGEIFDFAIERSAEDRRDGRQGHHRWMHDPELGR